MNVMSSVGSIPNGQFGGKWFIHMPLRDVC